MIHKPTAKERSHAHALNVAMDLLFHEDPSASGITYRLIMAMDRFVKLRKTKRTEELRKRYIEPACFSIECLVEFLEKRLSEGGAR